MSIRICRTCLVLATHNSPVPFLYQTRTLSHPVKWNARQCRSTSNTSSDSNSDKTEERADGKSQTSSVPESSPRPASDGPRRKSYLQRRAASVSQPQPQPPRPSPRPSTKPLTMTRTEKKVFSDLLEQLGVDENQAGETAAATGLKKPTLSEEDRTEMSQISAIFDSVLEDIRKRKQRSGKQTGAASRRELATTSESGTQQQQAQGQNGERALGELPPAELRSDDPVSMERAIQLTVQRESAKIEAALRAAIDEGRGDVGIWEVCKERIFSMLRYLGDERLLPEARDDFGASPEIQGDSFLDVPASVSVEAVVTALYPKVLLVAFRLLNSHFPGSPLISQFRSTIKSHGRTSAVLGSSTGLYNELIYFYWRGCNDLPSVVALLEEMEVTGVEPDERTCGLLKAIAEHRERDLKLHWERVRRENRGSVRDPWWDMVPNRKAVRELFGPDGWLQRLEARVQELRGRRDFL